MHAHEAFAKIRSRRPLLGRPTGAGFFVRTTLLFVVACIAAAQQDSCDPQLVQPADNPYGYRLRGERCEGIYVRQVSSSALLLCSFTRVFDDFDPSQAEALLVQWSAPSSTQVRVRARTLDRRLHYRMDAVRAPATASLRWPVDLMYALQIRRNNLGVLAWVPSNASPIRRELYLPVRVFQKKRPSQSQSLQVALLPGLELAEVYISLATVSSDSRPERMIRDGEALRYGYYPPERAITFSVPAPGSEGIYYLEIAAKLQSGGSVTLPVWFYHSQRDDAVRSPSANQ